MGVHVCSLIRQDAQFIPAGGYHLVRFPFGQAESSDLHEMHQVDQPGGHVVRDWDCDDSSALIWPAVYGWGSLTAMIQWEGGGYRELRDQFVRDPMGVTSSPMDTTATDHRAPTPGMQGFTKHHEILVYPGTPIGLRVGHNDREPRRLIHAQLKLAIHHVAEGAGHG